MLLGSTVTADPKSIREVDFNNFSYPWDGEPYRAVPERWSWMSPFPQSKVTLTQGRKDLSPPDTNELGCPYLMFRSVTHGDLDGDGRDEAAVDLLYGTGGTANWHYLYIYTFDQGSPKLLALLEIGSRADGGLSGLSIQKGFLVLDFLDKDKRMGDCCSEGYIRVHYRWKKGHFTEQGSRTYGALEVIEYPLK